MRLKNIEHLDHQTLSRNSAVQELKFYLLHTDVTKLSDECAAVIDMIIQIMQHSNLTATFDVFKKIIMCFNIDHIASANQFKLVFMLLCLQWDAKKKDTECDSLLVLFHTFTLLSKINQTVQTVHVINVLQIENINADVQSIDDNHEWDFPILLVLKCLIALIHW